MLQKSVECIYGNRYMSIFSLPNLMLREWCNYIKRISFVSLDIHVHLIWNLLSTFSVMLYLHIFNLYAPRVALDIFFFRFQEFPCNIVEINGFFVLGMIHRNGDGTRNVLVWRHIFLTGDYYNVMYYAEVSDLLAAILTNNIYIYK